jgi:hypothetical protein
VRKRIVNVGVPATHDSITTLPNLNERISLSDFDALVLNPTALSSGLTQANRLRRQNELRDLILRKGGIVVCMLRPNDQIIYGDTGQNGGSIYSIFNSTMSQGLMESYVQRGFGSQIKIVPNAKGASGGYFRVLQGTLSFSAYLNTDAESLAKINGTVFAFDSVPNPIAVEFAVGPGRICFVPAPEGATGDRVGSAIVRVVEAHFGGPAEIDSPSWLAEIAVPGATAHDTIIVTLEQKKEQIESEISKLKQNRSELLNYRTLLHGYGKSVLEPVVRSALRLFGFGVPEPDEYNGEWDVELHSESLSTFAIGEVEGSEGFIDVDKYRQLLDYIQAETLEGRDHKGILIGNGFRLAAPEAPERLSQFSDHALRGARKNGFCLLPTSELFKAVCAVLENPADEGLKIRIRDSIISATNVWAFARGSALATAEIQAAKETRKQ